VGDDRSTRVSALASSSDVGRANDESARLATVRELVAPGGRLGAHLSAAGARLQRVLGIAGSREGLGLVRAELELVRVALEDWARSRDGWACFRHSCAGFKPGCGGAWYFTPPGARAVRVLTGLHAVGRREGRTGFRGVERPRGLERPRVVAPGVVVRRELWRTGEVETPEAGLLTGVVYSIGADLELTAWREEARLSRGDEEVWLESGEEAFVVELL